MLRFTGIFPHIHVSLVFEGLMVKTGAEMVCMTPRIILSIITAIIIIDSHSSSSNNNNNTLKLLVARTGKPKYWLFYRILVGFLKCSFSYL